MATKEVAAQAKKHLEANGTPERKLLPSDFLSWGLTLLDLACYGEAGHGLAKGYQYLLVGGSGSGKTFLGRTILAEASLSPHFKDHKLIYECPEFGDVLEDARFFPDQMIQRMTTLQTLKSGKPDPCVTIEDLYKRLQKRLAAKEKIVCVVDSLDSLDGVDINGMTDNKAKAHSQEMRKLLRPMHDTGSILLSVCQVRAVMNRTSFFGPTEQRSGGNAPTFYATLEVWLKKTTTIMREYKDKKFPVGIKCQAHVVKNRLEGLDRKVPFRHYREIGIDDVGSCLDFLEEFHWKKERGIIKAPELKFEGSRDELIAKVEADDLRRELRVVTAKVWKTIEAAVAVNRKSPYRT